MLENFLNSIQWWHWIIFGFIFLMIELLTSTFVMIGFGVSAITIGVVSYFFPISSAIQIAIWSILSALYLLFWYSIIRKRDKDSNIGQSNYNKDLTGIVIEDITPNERGMVRFERPLLGSKDWYAIAKEPIYKGSSVKIIKVISQIVEVERI